jgi:S-adenosylmethionine:tRNA ribosyltransferase-isomerase
MVAATAFTEFINNNGMRTLNFELPSTLEAGEPPEARGLARDAVRLMVSHYKTDHITHTHFHEMAQYLNPGDVVVINTSGTMNAALPAVHPNGTELELHLSTRLPADLWIVEIRQSANKTTVPFYSAKSGDVFQLPADGTVTLLTAHNACLRQIENGEVRLWIAILNLPEPLADYLNDHGFPIRYNYVQEAWPLDYYQTAYVTEIGSAEMPSAGRAFTPELITKLVARGVQIAPLVLHTGVASLEEHEVPYEEFYRVPAYTAEMVNRARKMGKRVIAVGTTAVRALETVTDDQGITWSGEGWTSLVITPQRGLRAVDGLLTGFHEPKATHLAMLAALTGQAHLRITYHKALVREYLWHEFGDLHLILP